MTTVKSLNMSNFKDSYLQFYFTYTIPILLLKLSKRKEIVLTQLTKYASSN